MHLGEDWHRNDRERCHISPTIGRFKAICRHIELLYRLKLVKDVLFDRDPDNFESKNKPTMVEIPVLPAYDET